jgi:hypothetical protein
MSLKDEKIRAIKSTREFLRELLDPSKTPKVPQAIRKQAYSCLRHFPFDHDIAIREDVLNRFMTGEEYVETLKALSTVPLAQAFEDGKKEVFKNGI